MPPPLKSYWLKPQCEKTLLVEIPTKTKLPGLNYGPKKIWLAEMPPPPLKSYWLKPQCEKTLLVEIPTKTKLPGLNYGPKKSDWLRCPPLKSYWLKPQCRNTLLVGCPMKNNLGLRSGQPLCSFDPLRTHKQANKQFIFTGLCSTRKRISHDA